MIKSIHLKLILALIVFSINSWGQEDSLQVLPAVPLDVYSGAESILLVWEIPDSLVAVSTSIYRSNDPVAGFDSLIDIFETRTRFLDRAVEPDTRYFYRLEMIADTGEMITSSLETPPFTVAVTSDLQVDSTLLVIDSTAEFSEVYFDYLLNRQIENRFAGSDSIIHDKLYQLLKNDDPFGWEWFDHFRYEKWDVFHQLESSAFSNDFLSALEIDFFSRESKLRNHHLLTPEEWQNVFTQISDGLLDRLNMTGSEYSRVRGVIDSFDPLRIIEYTVDSTGQGLIEYLVVDSRRLDGIEINIAINDNLFSLLADDSLYTGRQGVIALPENNGWLKLEIDDRIIQSFGLDSTAGEITCFLNGNYWYGQNDLSSADLLESTKAPYLLNEVIFDADEHNLMVETTPSDDSTQVFGLLLRDSLIIPDLRMNGEYFIGELNLDESMNQGWLSLAQLQTDSSWLILDSRPLWLEESFFESRIPDGGPWVTTSFATLGSANDLTRSISQEIAIPEVFALYQNFPNPFNSTTTISFDLLQPANITLFIADATGRTIDVFMEAIPTDPGNYQFSWDGRGRSSGVYFFTIQAQIDDFVPVTFSRKMIYLK